MFFQLFIIQLCFIPKSVQSIQVGSIRNVALSSSAATVALLNVSCRTCICMMISTENILGVGCTQNQSCSLVYNYSLAYNFNVSPNSSFHFLSLPPEQVSSTDNSFDITAISKGVAMSVCKLLEKALSMSSHSQFHERSSVNPS